jgi:hypothetical protein
MVILGMTVNLRFIIAIAIIILAGCQRNDSIVKACEHVDGSYSSEPPFDIRTLSLTEADKGIEKAASIIPLCYARHPVKPYPNYLMRRGFYTSRDRLYIVYRIAGHTNALLLFRVNKNGAILGATRTTLPFMTSANGS